MSTKTESNATAFANFPNLTAQEVSLVPVAFIKPTPNEIDIPLSGDLEPISSLADSTIEPVQQWVQLPTGERFIRPLVMVTCQTCYNRYTTPGTSYYMNQQALNTCMATPCT